MMEAESKFRALLIRISKLLSRKNVEELVFITREDINNRQLSEEFEESGNALKLFQAMMDRGLYTHDNPLLLLQHLKNIDRCDAAMMLQQEMGALSQNNHTGDQRMIVNQRSAPGIPTMKTAPVSNHLYPRLSMDIGQQEVPLPLPLHETLTPITSIGQPNEAFKVCASNPGTATYPCGHGCTAGTRTLEPEASLFGDSNSPRFPEIPERPLQSSNGDSKQLSGTYFTFPEPEKTRAAVKAPQDHQDMPAQPPPHCNSDTKCPLASGYSSSGPERPPMGVLPAGNCIPERLPQGSYGNDGSLLKAAYNLPFPVPASEEIFVAAVPQQTVQAARPDTTYMPHAQQRQQPAIGLHRPQVLGMSGIYHPKMEIEPLLGRPPPVPDRPPQRPTTADCGVQELELCRLSRRFSAGKVDDLGLELGFGDGRISQLKYDNPHDISRVFYHLMVEWRSAQHGGSNMRENLANHLRNIDCMEQAGDLEDRRFS